MGGNEASAAAAKDDEEQLLERAEEALLRAAELVREQERPKSKEELIEEALNCPCIAKMKDGPCGDAFVAAYRCFLESETEPRGMDCVDKFQGMQECMLEHPDEYDLGEQDQDKASSPSHESELLPGAEAPVSSGSEQNTGEASTAVDAATVKSSATQDFDAKGPAAAAVRVDTEANADVHESSAK
ncbi:Mitochondrial intermembrane space import and assembly protein 40 [Porphyridium purpureum]|uniref:Mitochondrial intermembrane space import and assembly protein 40 n=1 Tax=Porphyridium purpureum TaxID=35688 RepID=A0A5J4YJ00_PORPP|nr:Mitochondrial intermembrane space import and assembly protein 40 [Porphyridium purpureum]|eukprot:POR3165..scf251_18